MFLTVGVSVNDNNNPGWNLMNAFTIQLVWNWEKSEIYHHAVWDDMQNRICEFLYIISTYLCTIFRHTWICFF